MDRLHRRRPPRPASPIPLAVSLTGGQRNDVTQLLALIDGVGPVRGKIGRPRQRAERLVADRGYDHDTYRRELPKRGVKPVIARRGTDHGSGLGRERWVVERTFAHLHNPRRLRIRYERDDQPHLAFMPARLRRGLPAPPRRLLGRVVVGLAPVLVGQPAPAP